MNEPLCYRGRPISAEDIASIRRIIAQNPRASRRKLSVLVCQAWEWRQANGAWRDMVCRSLMLVLHRAGHIELPPQRQSPANPLARRAKPATDFLLDQNPLRGPLRALQPLVIRQVRRTGEESLFNGLIERYHYLGYRQPVGEQLKYLVCTQDLSAVPGTAQVGRLVACLAWSSGPWHMGPRDRFIGWSPAVRRRHLHLLAYNTRFLILPWVQVPHLASHLLGRMARQLSDGLRASAALPGDIRGPGPLQGHELPGRELAVSGPDHGAGHQRQATPGHAVAERCTGLSALEGLPREALRG
jgi:hypothetical protein